MSKEQPQLRFDHREIAVVFSLFVFVSLLMFTVGILVGKGLAQAKYEAVLLRDTERLRASSPVTPPSHPPTGMNAQPGTVVPDVQTAPAAPDAVEASANPAENRAPAEAPAGGTEVAKKDEPLKLVPQQQRPPDAYGGSLQEPRTVSAEAANILKNPKIKGLFEEDGAAPVEKKRNTASVPKPGAEKKAPQSLAQGKFTVQVGSYTSEKDAAERVEALKGMGFPHAYFSAKELGEKKETYYRVWLGYFNDSQSAQQSGQILQAKGEVKNFLVRKTDAEN